MFKTFNSLLEVEILGVTLKKIDSSFIWYFKDILNPKFNQQLVRLLFVSFREISRNSSLILTPLHGPLLVLPAQNPNLDEVVQTNQHETECRIRDR